MPRYMVERHLPGFTSSQLAAAAASARKTTAEMTKEGVPVRYLRSTFVPSENRCFCLFDGPSVEAVKQANERAGLPHERIIEVVHIASEDVA